MATVALVTGGNNGLGYEIVKALLQASKPYHVLLGSRSMDKAKAAVENLQKEVPETKNTVEIVQVDLSSDESIKEAFEQVQASPGRIDSLINNAGHTLDILYARGQVGLRESFMGAYDVNVAGTNVLTHTFMPLLLKSQDPRLLFITGLSQITLQAQKYFPTPDLPAGWPKEIPFETIGYKCSKNALNMLMLDWNHKLKADGVKVWGVGPGMMITGLGYVKFPKEDLEKMGSKHPSIAAEMIKGVVEGDRDADTGRLVTFDGRCSPW